MSTTRLIRHYFCLKSAAQTQLGLPEAPIDWQWEGVGFAGNLKTRRPDAADVPGNPIAGITRRDERWIIIPWVEIYNLFFTSIPQAQLTRLTLSFTPTQIFFNLNLEE